MNSLELYEKIEDYLQGRLPDADRRAFEVRMETDEELADEVALHREAMEASGDHEMIDFRAQLDAIAEEIESEQGPSDDGNASSWNWQKGLLGLLVIAVLTATVWLAVPDPPVEAVENEMPPPSMQEDRAPPTEKTTAPAFPGEEPSAPAIDRDRTLPIDSDPPPPIAKVPEEEANPYLAMAVELYRPATFDNVRQASEEEQVGVVAKAKEAYQKGAFQEAIDLLSSVETDTPNYLEAKKVLGHAYFRNEDYAAAGRAFQEVIDSGYPAFAEEVAWERLLGYLALGETENDAFRKLIQEMIEDPEHPDHANAMALSRRLGNEK